MKILDYARHLLLAAGLFNAVIVLMVVFWEHEYDPLFALNVFFAIALTTWWWALR